jgi:drug/metabolite transporter (DMT)-like permease
VIAILGGLGAAACWATATMCASRSTRLIGAGSVLAWVMTVGLVVTAPVIAFKGIPTGLGSRQLAWIGLSAAGNLVGLFFAYEGLRVGKVSIVAPITSTEGAIAAVLAVVTGETLGIGSAVMLGLVAAGVALASITPGGASGDAFRASLFAAGAATCFGSSLYATAKVSHSLPIIWAVSPVRFLGVAVIAVPLLATGRLKLTRKAFPLVLVSGLCEVVGVASYAVGSRHGIAVSAVLASQFAAIASIAAFVLFRERLTRLQLTGIVAIVVGVATLSALNA